MNKRNRIIQNAKQLGGWLLLAALYIADVIFVGIKGRALLNSDASAEMVLSDLLNEEHRLISTNWYYSTELRVLNTQFIYKIGLKIFPSNWHCARTLSVALFLLLLIGCGIFLCRAIDLPKLCPWFGCALIAPIGKWYAWNVIYNSYYVPHIVLSLLTIALMFQSRKSTKKMQRILLTIMLMLICCGAGLGGVRQLFITFAPLWIATVLFVISRKFRLDWKLLGLSTGMLVSGGVGLLINSHILTRILVFNHYDQSTYFNAFDLGRFVDIVGDYFGLFGWRENVRVISVGGMGNMLGIALAGCIVIAGILLMRRLVSEADGTENGIVPGELDILTMFVVVAFFLLALIYAGSDSYNESYWTLMVPWGILLFLIAIEKNCHIFRDWMLYLFLAATFLVGSYETMKDPYISWVPNDLALLDVGEFIKESDYNVGMSTFWNGPIITELTEGRVDMWVYTNYEIPIINKWLQVDRGDKCIDESFFLLYQMGEDLPIRVDEATIEEHIIYRDENYIVYGFEGGWREFREFLGKTDE